MLLELVKEELRITWDDEDTRLISMIERAKASLNKLMGIELDYEKPGPAQDLLLARCRYDYNNALEYFEQNFAREILRLQLQVAAEEVSTDGGA
ncbi:MAG TPA: phage head-tail connector protein [Limnochordia bacterium]|nr:phage head-tail connector protein [Limnochordia bacterium]